MSVTKVLSLYLDTCGTRMKHDHAFKVRRWIKSCAAPRMCS